MSTDENAGQQAATDAPKPKKAATDAPKPKKAATDAPKPKKATKPAKAAKAKKPKSSTAKSVKGPGALKEYAPKYVHDKEHKTASGNVSVHCGDPVAKKLAGKSLDDLYPMVAKALAPDGPDEKELRKKYAHLNAGMQRMNLGNRLRAQVNAK